MGCEVKPPPSILPHLRGLSNMATRALFVAYATADRDGMVEGIRRPDRLYACEQGREEILTSLDELQLAGLVVISAGPRGEVLVQLTNVERLTDGEALRACRRDLGETLQRFASRLGVTATTIWRWERGECPMPERVLAILPARSEAA